jgi:hypothetical protein
VKALLALELGTNWTTPVKRVVIGMDPHEWSVTIDARAADECRCRRVRLSSDAGRSGEAAVCKQWPQGT